MRTVPRHHLRAEAFGGLSCGAFKLQQLQGGTQAQRVASLLDGHEDDEAGALSDDEVRAGVKMVSAWPTFPQLFVNGELVGGSDIVAQLHDSGELRAILAPPAP